MANELNRFREEFLSRDSSPRRRSLADDERRTSSTFVNAPVEHNVKLPIETMFEFKQFDRLLETNSKAFDDFVRNQLHLFPLHQYFSAQLKCNSLLLNYCFLRVVANTPLASFLEIWHLKF